jgi:hypothetical protein
MIVDWPDGAVSVAIIHNKQRCGTLLRSGKMINTKDRRGKSCGCFADAESAVAAVMGGDGFRVVLQPICPTCRQPI